jgi:hypothetical protein
LARRHGGVGAGTVEEAEVEIRSTAGTCIGMAGMLLVASACGGGRAPVAPSPSLASLERLAIAQQIVSTAVAGVVGDSYVRRSDDGPLSKLSCEKTCGDGACTIRCPIQETIDCPAGGQATDEGLISGTLDAEESGRAALDARQTYADCRPREGLAITGAPATSAAGTAVFVKGELSEPQTVRIAGAVQYVSTDGSGHCDVDLRVTFSRALHGSAQGTACSESINVTF